MPELKFIVKNANGRILFKDAGGNIIQDRPDYEAVGLTGELYPESITVGAGENTYSFVIPANGGITYTTAGGTPTSYTGNAAGLLTILSANFFNASTGSGGGGGGDATAAKQDEQTTSLQNIKLSAALSRFSLSTIDSTNQQIVSISEQSRVAIGEKTDAAVINPALDASMIALLKGVISNTAPAPTASNHFRNSATTNSVLVKSGAGKVLSGAFTNRTTGTKYLRGYNTNSAPTPTLTPLFEISAPTGATVQIPKLEGFGLGIAYIISGSANQNGVQLTTADACSVQLQYL